jgi:cytochrome c553
MKKASLWALGVALAIAWVLAPSAGADIAGSPHDFTSGGGGGFTALAEICEACHTPHGADTTVTEAPLWDHAATSKTFTAYTSDTITATDLGAPAGISKLCLSCHDGSVAIDSFGGVTGTNTISTDFQIASDGDMSKHHPVSFSYDDALATADGELFVPSSATTTLGGTIQADLLFGPSGSETELECASCHDVHATGPADEGTNASLLRISNAGSAFCLTCHNK